MKYHESFRLLRAIKVQYLGPTDRLPARYRATHSESRRLRDAVTMSVHALEGEGCPQEVVARILMRKREWNHRTALVGGQLKDGVWVFVMVPTGTVIE